MRVLSVGSIVLLLSLAVAAQSPARSGAAKSADKPTGNLIQVMRGVLFNNANLIFDVQHVDPARAARVHSGEGATTTQSFASVYTGWQIVENAAVAIDESIDTMLKPGRSCQNGIPVPVGDPTYVKTAMGLRQVAHEILKAAQAKNRDRVMELSGDLSEACAACHVVYRDPEGPKGFGDNSIRCKVPAKKG